MSQAEDIDAINVYFNTNGPSTTGQAATIYQQWKTFYNGLGWYSKTLSTDTYNQARKLRDDFNAAKGTPTLPYGLTSEQVNATNTEFTKMPAVITYLTPTAEPGQIHATIKQGDQGPDVMAWQKIIKVTADGKFGPATDKATRTWQQQHGITPDGIVGPQTWSVATGETVQTVPAGMVPTPAQLPTVKSTATASVIKAPVAPTQAGIVGAFNNLSLPVKAGIALATVGAGVYYNENLKKKHR